MSNSIIDLSKDAIYLLLSGDHELWSIILVSITVSIKAIILSMPIGLLIAIILAYTKFPGRKYLIIFFNSLLSLPTVVIGLTLYMLLSKSGPFGDLKLLFTQTAMVIGQMIICLPIIISMAHSAFQALSLSAWETALTHTASYLRAIFTVFYETRFGLISVIILAFGRIITEVGSSMMVGGNILHSTRNIPTAIALEATKGEFAQGIALGMVLILLAFMINIIVGLIQGKGRAVIE